MISPNTLAVLNYLKTHSNDNLTSADVAEATGLPKKTVDGAFTLAIQKKGYGTREEKEVVFADGTKGSVKFLRLTAEGKAWNPEAEA